MGAAEIRSRHGDGAVMDVAGERCWPEARDLLRGIRSSFCLEDLGLIRTGVAVSASIAAFFVPLPVATLRLTGAAARVSLG
jgi:hypothetical protein